MQNELSPVMSLRAKLRAYFAPHCPVLARFTRVAHATAERYQRADLGQDIARIVKYRARKVADGHDERAQLMLLREDVVRMIPSAEIARARLYRGIA